MTSGPTIQGSLHLLSVARNVFAESTTLWWSVCRLGVFHDDGWRQRGTIYSLCMGAGMDTGPGDTCVPNTPWRPDVVGVLVFTDGEPSYRSPYWVS